ncbi:hypothetical protein ACGFRG_25600 [Streptomyces sp. NPDC048696]|uniref:hypothetical protein n=1 Tax=Streptomyces sp. NPDC048696 TaxID=3365585 RepID=UPI00371B8D52
MYDPRAIMQHFTDYKANEERLSVEEDLLRMAFHIAAEVMVNVLPPGAERSAGLRKLLEARDCAFRAELDKE